MPPNEQGSEILRYSYLFIAALAGGISALAFLPWRTMGRMEIAFTVFVGTSFSLFVVPYIATAWIHMPPDEIRGMVAACYVGGAGAFTFLPKLISKFGRGEPK